MDGNEIGARRRLAGARSIPAQRGRKRVGWLVGLALLAAAIAALAWFARKPDSALNDYWRRIPGIGGTDAPGARMSARGAKGAGADRSTPVSVAEVRRQDIHVSTEAIGTVTARATAVVRTKIDGDLMSVHFVEGQQVKAGALLAEIDPAPLKIALAQAEAALARDNAQLRSAQRDLQRFRGLLGKDAIARQQVDTQQALVAQLDGTVAADKAQVDAARLQLSYSRIRAPIAGVVGLRRIDAGNRVRASDIEGLATIVQLEPVDVVFSVPEAILPSIRRQRAAGSRLAVELYDRDRTARLAQGSLSTIDNAIDSATGSIRAKAAFPNADRALFPNQFVNVRLQLDTRRDVLAVPVGAIQRAARGATLSVVGQDMKLTSRAVTTGARDGEWIEVSGEIQVGDRVVVDGAERVAAGATVRVVEPAGVAADERPAWVRRLSQTDADAVMKLPADKRRDWMLARIEARIAETEALFAAGKRPDWWSRIPPDGQERLLGLSSEQRMAWMRQRAIERSGINDAK